jgi:hypothetical protein
MFQKLGGLIGDIIPFLIFLYFSLIASGVIKSDSLPERFKNPTLYMKYVFYAGTLLFAALIVIGLLR